MKFFWGSLIVLFMSITITSCNDNENNYIIESASNDAQIALFSLTAFAENALDTINYKALAKTKFSIVQTNQTEGHIYNPEPLPYKTRLKKFLPSIGFSGGSGLGVEIKYLDNDSTITWETTDSIDFSKDLVFIVTPPSGNPKKTYSIDIRIRKNDPDSIIWTPQSALLVSGINKSFVVENSIYSFVKTNSEIVLNKTLSAATSWSNTATNLPTTAKIENMVYANKLFNVVATDGKTYTSSDAISWTAQSPSSTPESIIGVMPLKEGQTLNKILVLMADNTFAYTEDMNSFSPITKIGGAEIAIPNDFPVKGFSNWTYTDPNSRFNNLLILVGGTDRNGNKSNLTWYISNTSSDDNIDITRNQSNRIFNVSEDLSIFHYDKKMYAYVDNAMYSSLDLGLKWDTIPTKQNPVSEISLSKGKSVVIDQDNYLWIIGGDSSTSVQKGRLNAYLPWDAVIE